MLKSTAKDKCGGTSPPSTAGPSRWAPPVVSLLLAAIVIGIYARTLTHSFLSFDDNVYVTENSYVNSGFNWGGVAWAFRSTAATNWHPLTWLSHILDCQIYGLNPWGHHLTNLLLHIANTLLLFSLLLRMTGSIWRGAFTAALFGVHPLHVESVAWIAERKDVLSAFFWLATMWFYVSFTKRPSTRHYVLVVLVFMLGLMTKPMLVTLPLVLLLIDFWPLNRLQATSKKASLIIEKIPLFMLSIASAIITFIAQRQGGAVSSLSHLSFSERLINAVCSYTAYLSSTIWPIGLSAFYPIPREGTPVFIALSAAALLLAITAVVFVYRKHVPCLFVGWSWYLITLIPVIGLVQVGAQARADRYTYIPLIGIFIAISWGIPDFIRRKRSLRGILTTVLKAAAIVWIVLLSVAAWVQAGFWRDSVSLFSHSAAVTKDNALAYNNWGFALSREGRLDEAIQKYKKALQISPKWAEARSNLADALSDKGDISEAIDQYRQAIILRPTWPQPANNLAWIMATHEQAIYRNGSEAVHLALRATELTHNTDPFMLDTLAAAYAEASQYPNAVATARRAIALAISQRQTALAEQIRQRLPLYEARRPYRYHFGIHQPDASNIF